MIKLVVEEMKRRKALKLNVYDDSIYNKLSTCSGNEEYYIEPIIITQKIRYDDKSLPINLNEKIFYSEKLGFRIYIIYQPGECNECVEHLKNFMYLNNFILNANKNSIIEYLNKKYYKPSIDDSHFSVSDIQIFPDFNNEFHPPLKLKYKDIKLYINNNYFNETNKLVYGYFHNEEYDYYTNILEYKCKVKNIGDRL